MTVPNVAPVATAAAATTNPTKGSKPKKFCYYCNIEGHNTNDCQHFPSATEKRAALKAKNRCEDCRAKKIPGHRCYFPRSCKICNGWHRWQLCTKGDNEPYKLK